MRTILLATLLCIAVAQSYAAEYVCYGSTCAGQGASCSGATVTNGIYPTCNYGLWCDGSVCQPDVALGGDCSATNAACVEGAECVENVCVAYRNYPGEACSQNSQCRQSADNGTVVASTCVSGKCAFIATGSACSASAAFDQCNVNALCIDSVCTAMIAAGQTCTTGGTPCVGDAACIEGKCVDYYSAPLNAACYDTQYCAAGLICNNASICANPTSQRTNIVCTDSSQCLATETCSCTPGVAAEQNTCRAKVAYTSAYVSATRGYESCQANDFACSNDWDSCSACDTQVCALFNADSSIFSTCHAGPRAKDLANRCKATSSASTVAISAAVGVAAVIALF